MKKITLFPLILLLFNFATAQYRPSETGTSVTFKLKNFGFGTGGSFSGMKGKIQFDPKNPASAAFDMTIDATTVNTDNESRDGHLREETYFDVKNHPQIHFVSTGITALSKPGNFQITGMLTIKATTKEISFPFSATPSGDGYLFKGEFRINRRDYGVGGSSTLSDNVDVTLNVLAIKS